MIGKVASLETLYPSQGSTTNSVAIGKGHLKLLYNANGGLYQYSNGKNLVLFLVVLLCTVGELGFCIVCLIYLFCTFLERLM
jgi:hypothetical protein